MNAPNNAVWIRNITGSAERRMPDTCGRMGALKMQQTKFM